jgi:hypothetical protein
MLMNLAQNRLPQFDLLGVPENDFFGPVAYANCLRDFQQKRLLASEGFKDLIHFLNRAVKTDGELIQIQQGCDDPNTGGAQKQENGGK